jgi:diguanylate cyclase (GGDEF)-like protein/PAS domain S-box-containing protein
MTEPGCDVADGGSTAPWSLGWLAREWARAIATTGAVPTSSSDTGRYLSDLLQRLEAALSGSVVDTDAAFDVGGRLVAGHFTDSRSLSRTVEVLGRGLPTAPEGAWAGWPGNRVVELLAALVAGYVAALRQHICDQQKSVEEAPFSPLVNSAVLGIVISDPDGRITQTNPMLGEILGYSADELLGHELSELFFSDDLPAFQRGCQHLLSGDKPWFRTQLQLRRKDGETAHTQLTVSVLRDATQEPRCLVTMVADLTELHLLHEWLNHQTLHDLQTGLPNRQYFVSHLEEVLGCLEPSAVLTLLHLDLDGFSVINDGLGHRYGDQVLSMVARRLESVVADQQAMVARIGGDEYAILIQPGNSIPEVGQLAETINTELAEAVYHDDIGVAVTARIGMVQRQAGGTESGELMRAASATLRRLRGSGGQWAMFDEGSDAADCAELRLAAGMPGALETGELQVQYRPVAALADGRLTGIEALLTWHHPELGALSHDRCMQLAERTGVVHAVGSYLLTTAADQTRLWQQRAARLPPTVINLTHSQAQDPHLVARVKAMLEQAGLRPTALELGVPTATIHPVNTEHVVVTGGQAADNLRALANLGVHTALHDFGCDISELACLTELQVHAVRITQSVAQQVAYIPSAIAAQALRALVPTLRAAGINVIATMVDTERLSTWWREIGANCAVGALFGQPGPPQHTEQLLGPHIRLGA